MPAKQMKTLNGYEIVDEAGRVSTASLRNEHNTLKARVDNLIAPEGGTLTLDEEVVDARVGADGIIYPTLGDAVRASDGKLDEIMADVGLAKTTLLDFATDKYLIPFAGLFILRTLRTTGRLKRIAFKTGKTGSYEVDVSIWVLKNGVFNRLETQTFSGDIVDGQFTINIDYYNTCEYYIGFYSDDDIYGYEAPAEQGVNGIIASTDRNAPTIQDVYGAAYLPQCKISVITGTMGLNAIECHVGKGYEYSQIQEALDNNADADFLTIYLHPSDTPYKRFSTMRRLDEAYPWGGSACKNISIIGTDKAKCIVRDDSGDYDTPPAEIACNGIVKNITFIATHDKANGSQINPSYAVHVDNRPVTGSTMDLSFENCDFISYNTAGVGLGIYQNQKVRFEKCRFENNADLTYKPNENYADSTANIGAYFMHTAMGYAAGNMGAEFIDCVFIGVNTDKSFKIEVNEESDFTVTAINNTMWSHAANGHGFQHGGYEFNQKPYNRGNNVEKLNAI